MILKQILHLYTRFVTIREYKNQRFTRFNERPVELAFVFRKLGEIYPLKILDIGTGLTALPHLMRNCGSIVTATDNIKDYYPAGMYNRHYHILNDDITQSNLADKYDLITCISVLEHIEESDAAVSNMFNLLNSKGSLLLTFPYKESKYVRNVYELPGSSYGKDNAFITQSYSRADVDRWLTRRNIKIVEQEYWQFWDGDYWTVGSQIIPPVKVTERDNHQISCIHFQRMD